MAEHRGVPDYRCGFELKRDDIDVDLVSPDPHAWDKQIEPVCCWRVTWKDTERCIWHAEVDDKPIKELMDAREEHAERLDGAYLVGVEAGDDLSFRECGLRFAVFSDSRFEYAEFHEANLLGAQFHNARLNGAKFSKTHLRYARFHDAFLPIANFYDADLTDAKFHDANVKSAVFADATLFHAEFRDVNLSLAQFPFATLTGTEFHDANLYDAHFHKARLHNAKFHSSYLSFARFHYAELTDADCIDSDASYTDFTYAILHDTVFMRTDCRKAIFSRAFLYETVFTDARINSQTIFYDSSRSRPVVVYEDRPSLSEELPEDVHPFEAAEWVYCRLEKLHDENALSEDARDFHISKEEVRRKYQRESEEYVRSTSHIRTSLSGESAIVVYSVS